MKRDKQQMTTAMQRSWRPGGPSRIAYEKRRMQEKKTSSLVDQTGDIRRLMEDQRTSQPAAEVSGHPRAEIACAYYKAACLLLLADQPDYRKPAEQLIAEAEAIYFGD